MLNVNFDNVDNIGRGNNQPVLKVVNDYLREISLDYVLFSFYESIQRFGVFCYGHVYVKALLTSYNLILWLKPIKEETGERTPSIWLQVLCQDSLKWMAIFFGCIRFLS